jgi:hypothetical protein
LRNLASEIFERLAYLFLVDTTGLISNKLSCPSQVKAKIMQDHLMEQESNEGKRWEDLNESADLNFMKCNT